MRILLVISSLSYGGAERQVVLLSKQLVRIGHSVLVYTLNADVPRRVELEGSGVELHVDQKHRKLDVSVLGRLRKCIRQWRADVVHGFLFDGDMYSRFAACGLGIPVLNSERNDGFDLRFSQLLLHRLTRGLMDGLVANSHAAARVWKERRGLASSQLHVVWNGIDLAEVDRRLATGAAPAKAIWADESVWRVCIVGAIKPQKDHSLALRVAAELNNRDPRWRFLFVGDSIVGRPLHKQRILAEFGAMGADRYATFIGTRTDVLELMASSDVLLVSSRHEGFPNVVLEAMACGVPVATTDYSDVRRILPFDWQVCKSRSPSLLADIVERCNAERAGVVKAQRRWVETHASVDRAAARLLEVYARYAKPGQADSGPMPSGSVAR